MPGPALYTAPQTGQMRWAYSAGNQTLGHHPLEIHELGRNYLPRCGAKPGPGKVLVKLGRGSVTCKACAGFTGHL